MHSAHEGDLVGGVGGVACVGGGNGGPVPLVVRAELGQAQVAHLERRLHAHNQMHLATEAQAWAHTWGRCDHLQAQASTVWLRCNCTRASTRLVRKTHW